MGESKVNIFVGVSNGKFEFTFNGNHEGRKKVDATPEAIAEFIMKHKIYDGWMESSSVDFSEEYDLENAGDILDKAVGIVFNKFKENTDAQNS